VDETVKQKNKEKVKERKVKKGTPFYLFFLFFSLLQKMIDTCTEGYAQPT